jgi:hypothetical protein
VNDKIFTKGHYGVVSCYNSPLAGGGSTLVRLNLKPSPNTVRQWRLLQPALPHYCQQQMAIIDARCDFLFQQSGFFENSFLKEGLIDADRFVPMFGMYGLAEAVNVLCEKAGMTGRYGKPGQRAGLSHQRTACGVCRKHAGETRLEAARDAACAVGDQL